MDEQDESPWAKNLARLKAKRAKAEALAADRAAKQAATRAAKRAGRRKKSQPKLPSNATVDLDSEEGADQQMARQRKAANRIGRPAKILPPMKLSEPWATKLIPSEGLPEIELIARLSELSCTVGEAALFFRVTEKEFRARLLSDEALLESWNRARAVGKIGLRRLIRWHAERPNGSGVVAALALAREELGFKGTGYGGTVLGDQEKAQAIPRQPVDYSRLTTEELEILYRIQQKLGVGSQRSDGDRGDSEAAPGGGAGALIDAEKPPQINSTAPGNSGQIVE